MPRFHGGYTPNPKATEAFVDQQPKIYGDQISELVTADDNKDALLYRALTPCLKKGKGFSHWLKKRDGRECIVSLNQGSIGSCVGNAEARLLDILAAVEIILGEEHEEFRATFSPDGLYGLGREIGNMLRPGDGLYGSAIAKAVQNWGTLHQIAYGNVDLSRYSVSRCREYGRRGVGSDLKNEAKAHKVFHTARVNSGEEGWSLIGNGYTINQCSNLGWAGSRDKEGIIRRRSSWSHSMAATSRRTTSKGDRVILIQNSWGDNWAGGSYWEDMPWGSFWVYLKDFDTAIRQRDSFVHSGYQGFKPRRLPDFGAQSFFG